MPVKPILFEKVRSDLGNLEFDDCLPDYKLDLLNEIEPERFIVLGNQFFYLMDMQNYQCVMAHPNIKKILGYEQDEFKSFKELFELVHPDDFDFVLAFSAKSIAYSREISNKSILSIDPYGISFSIDHRMKKADGNYIRLNRQTICVKADRKGNMVYALAIFTDISHLNHKNYISCSWTGDELGLFSIKDIQKDYLENRFTARQIEIIKMFADGLDGKTIGKKLYISEHTVISHRKSILKKAGVSNTAELVKYGIDFGII